MVSGNLSNLNERSVESLDILIARTSEQAGRLTTGMNTKSPEYYYAELASAVRKEPEPPPHRQVSNYDALNRFVIAG